MAWYTAPSGVTCVAAYDAIGAASLADSYVNEANPGTYDAAPGTAPTWAYGTGWTFNGTTQYLNTGGLLIGSGYSMLVRFSGMTGNGNIAGCQDPANNRRFWIQPNRASNQRGYGYGTSGTLLVGTGATSGVIGYSSRAYYNGTLEGATDTTSANVGIQFAIGAMRSGAGLALYAAASIQAVAIYSGLLTGDDVSALTTAMNALPVAASVPTMMQHHAAMLARG